MTDPFAALGREMDTSRQLCTHSSHDTPDSDCGQTAAWHILWDTDLANGLSCNTHMATARSRFAFVDSHPVGPDCGMPGTSWDVDNKRCVYPGEPAADAFAVARAINGPA
ncbi:hypothetical protein ACWDBD_17140 [Streptomyces sp. NPDC001118]